jgi:hypothetical protein
VDQSDDALPPPGTAIVRPLRHVQAVRDYYLRRFGGPSEIAASRAARAWGWALGESATAPVTNRQTQAPPSLDEIEHEIAAADERRLSGERENRADAAATVLRWLIGQDDRVPVQCENHGELVGGFGDIVRSREQIAEILAAAIKGQLRAGAVSRRANAVPERRQCVIQDADYLSGVIETLGWIIGERVEAPITQTRSCNPTIKEIKTERLHAEDLSERAFSGGADISSPCYGEGVKSTIIWLLGDMTFPPLG